MAISLQTAGIATAAIYQLYVTYRLLRAPIFSAGQKWAQAAFIWIVPVVGAVVCHAVLLLDANTSGPRDSAFTPDGGENPVGTGQGSHGD
jgi:hypothetical protein